MSKSLFVLKLRSYILTTSFQLLASTAITSWFTLVDTVDPDMESQLALQLMGDGGSDQPDGKAGKCKFLAFYNWQIALPS